MSESSAAGSPLTVLAAAHRAALAGVAVPAELYAPDAVHERPFAAAGVAAQLAGRDTIIEFIRRSMSGLPVRFTDFDYRVVHETVDPEVIVVEYDVHGTVKESGKAFQFPVIMVLRARAGQIVSLRDYSNPVALPDVLRPSTDKELAHD